MAEAVESEESRRKRLTYTFTTTVCLVILDTFILGSPTLAIYARSSRILDEAQSLDRPQEQRTV